MAKRKKHNRSKESGTSQSQDGDLQSSAVEEAQRILQTSPTTSNHRDTIEGSQLSPSAILLQQSGSSIADETNAPDAINSSSLSDVATASISGADTDPLLARYQGQGPALRIWVKKQKLYFQHDDSPLVDIELARDWGFDEKELNEAYADLYRIFRVRREPWHKIKAIPWLSISASDLIRNGMLQKVRSYMCERLQVMRDTERAEIFRWLFPEIGWSEERMGVLDQQFVLRSNGYAMSELRIRRRARRSDASDFEAEEDSFWTQLNRPHL
ncbi:MAG: hypothetical protein Q9201_002489 [Fulgogasparrea decipioides]